MSNFRGLIDPKMAKNHVRFLKKILNQNFSFPFYFSWVILQSHTIFHENLSNLGWEFADFWNFIPFQLLAQFGIKNYLFLICIKLQRCKSSCLLSVATWITSIGHLFKKLWTSIGHQFRYGHLDISIARFFNFGLNKFLSHIFHSHTFLTY